jgi:CRP-like cAMP-binding protein
MTDAPQSRDAPRVARAARKIPLVGMVLRRLAPRQQAILSCLKGTPLFADLSTRELLEVLELVHERTYGPGEAIVTQGEPGLGLYVLMRGEVEVCQEGGARDARIARLGPGEVFGDVSFVDGSPRSATITAHQRAELIGLYRTELLDLMERNPLLASKILFSLARQLSARLRAMLQSSAR